MTALNIKCTACGARIKNGLKAKFGSHLKEVRQQQQWRHLSPHIWDTRCAAHRPWPGFARRHQAGWLLHLSARPPLRVIEERSFVNTPTAMLQVTIEEKSKAVVVRLADQAAVTNQALLAAMNELDSPASLVRRDIHKPPPPPP